MSAIEIALALFAVSCSTLGQLSLKAAAKQHKRRLFFLCLGLAALLAAAAISAVLLRTLPLSLFVPFAALAYITVPCAARIIFKEPIQPVFWVGVALIIAGVILTLV